MVPFFNGCCLPSWLELIYDSLCKGAALRDFWVSVNAVDECLVMKMLRHFTKQATPFPRGMSICRLKLRGREPSADCGHVGRTYVHVPCLCCVHMFVCERPCRRGVDEFRLRPKVHAT